MCCVDKSKENSISKYAWTRDYCFDTEDVDIQDQIVEFLEEVKNNILT